MSHARTVLIIRNEIKTVHLVKKMFLKVSRGEGGGNCSVHVFDHEIKYHL